MSYVRDARLAEFIDQAIENSPVEAEIVRRVIKAAADNGTPIIGVFDGDERLSVSDEQEILDLVFNLDEVYLYTSDAAMIFLVFGNDADELIADYSTSLETALAPVFEWIEAHA